jgi:hypothetical protein
VAQVEDELLEGGGGELPSAAKLPLGDRIRGETDPVRGDGARAVEGGEDPGERIARRASRLRSRSCPGESADRERNKMRGAMYMDFLSLARRT